MVRLTHFTPSHHKSWHWSFMQPLGDPVVGPTRTITGHTVMVTQPIQAWTQVPGTPQFPDQHEAAQWAQQEAFSYDLCDVPRKETVECE